MEKSIGLKKIKTAVFISGTGSNLKSLIKFSKLKKSPIAIRLIISNNPKAKGLELGKIFRIKGKGAASVRDSRRGDLLCRVIVETPVNLSKAQLKKFEEFTQSLAGEEHHPIKESFTKAANYFHNK